MAQTTTHHRTTVYLHGVIRVVAGMTTPGAEYRRRGREGGRTVQLLILPVRSKMASALSRRSENRHVNSHKCPLNCVTC